MIASGTIVTARDGLIEARIPSAAVGDGVRIRTLRGDITGTITALLNGRAMVATHDSIEGARSGDVACLDPAVLSMPLGTLLLGRRFDARGVPLDGGPPLQGRKYSLVTSAPLPSERIPVARSCWTGIRSIDGLLAFGRGARIGVFGPPGAGKSTLLHDIMAAAYVDAVVVALIGERGREAEEWMRRAPRHASIVCATSDRSAAERVRAAQIAMAQADNLRSRGLHVLLIIDSFARFAGALREIGLASGEAVGRGGYPPSVFAQIARYVEIAGAAQCGSITCIATVLSDGDERDPVSDAARSLLDGHIQLSAALAQAGHFPAIDVLGSASRTMPLVASPCHLRSAQTVRGAIATLARTSDARALGIMPADEAALRAVACEQAIEGFLKQGPQAQRPDETLSALHAIADKLE